MSSFDKEGEMKSTRFSFFHLFSRRLHLTLLMMLMIFCANLMRSNLSMTMTCMVNSTAVSMQLSRNFTQNVINEDIRTNNTCQDLSKMQNSKNPTAINDYGGSIIWSSKTQNLLFSASFWGALLASVPSGYLADRFSPTNLLRMTMFVLTLATAMFPYTALNAPYIFVFIIRALMGVGQGLLLPSVHALTSRWIPNSEKPLAVSIYTSGNQLGGVLGLPLAAVFCASTWQWPAVYYFGSFIGLILMFSSILMVSDTPEKAKLMKEKEKIYLEENLDKARAKKEKFKAPWGKILTSLPVIAFTSCAFSISMVAVIMQIYLPTFFKEILFLNVVDNGLYSAIPFVVQFIAKILWSLIMDIVKRRKLISDTNACKLSQTICTTFVASSLILLGYLPDCQRPWIAVLLVCGIASGFGVAINGFYVSMLCLAPPYTGILSSMHTILGFIGMISTPNLVSLCRVYGTREEWRIVFLIISGFMIATGIFFLIFGQAEVQTWAKIDEHKNEIPLKTLKEQANLIDKKEIIEVRHRVDSIFIK